MTSAGIPRIIERARSRRPVTWITLIGVLLLPVVIGGILVAALYNPAERLDSLNAAIVNDDEPVTINDQLVPLGRQLTAGLVEGSDEQDSNLTWTISNADDAEEGLADGTYDAVITIPENFSAAATSTAPGGTPEQATIEVQTAPDALIVDDAITAQVTQAAASLMGEQLSQVYLENVFLGFTTLGDQLGEAAAAPARSPTAHSRRPTAQPSFPAASPSSPTARVGSRRERPPSPAASTRSRRASASPRTVRPTSPRGSTRRHEGEGARAQRRRAADRAVRQDRRRPDRRPRRDGGRCRAVRRSPRHDLGGLDAGLRGLGGLALTTARAWTPPSRAHRPSRRTPELPRRTPAPPRSARAPPAATPPPPRPASARSRSQTSSGLTDAADGARGLASGLDKLAAGTTQSADGARQLASGASQLSSGGDQLATGAQSLADGVAQLASGSDGSPPDSRPRPTRSPPTPTPKRPTSRTSSPTRSSPRVPARACSAHPRSRCS